MLCIFFLELIAFEMCQNLEFFHVWALTDLMLISDESRVGLHCGR